MSKSKKQDDKQCPNCLKPKWEGEWHCNCGRPTKFKEEFCLLVEEYLQEEVDNINKKEVNLPSQEWYFAWLNKRNKTSIALSTWKDWKLKHPLFSVSLEVIHQEQKKRLLNNWLAGTYNSTIAKLILSANHNMNETNKTELTGKDWQPLALVIQLPAKRDD